MMGTAESRRTQSCAEILVSLRALRFFAALREGNKPGSLQQAPFDKLRDPKPNTLYPIPF